MVHAPLIGHVEGLNFSASLSSVCSNIHERTFASASCAASSAATIFPTSSPPFEASWRERGAQKQPRSSNSCSLFMAKQQRGRRRREEAENKPAAAQQLVAECFFLLFLHLVSSCEEPIPT